MTARTTVLVIVVVALLALPAFAQTPRQAALGGGFAGVSVDETASFNNPAGLPLLDTFGTNVSPWPSRASLNILVDGPDDLDQYSALYAGRAADNTSGWGAGYMHTENGMEVDGFALGYGQRVGNNLTAGVAVLHQSMDVPGGGTAAVDDDSTTVNLGAMYRREIALNAWRFGFIVADVADEMGGPFFHLGAGVELPAGVDVAATLADLTDEVDTTFNIGAEWEVPMTDFIVRAGANDGDFTAGAAYRWTNFEVGLSWVDGEDDDLITAGATGCF